MAPLVRRLAGLAQPAVWLLAGSTGLVMHPLSQRDEGLAPASEEEIKYLMGEGARAGVFAGMEQELVERVFRFADLRVGELPAGESYQFNTLAGPVIAELGRLPRVGDDVVAGGRRFDVVDMVGRRVDRVLISAPRGKEADPPPSGANL